MQTFLSILPIDWWNTRNQNRTGAITGAFLSLLMAVICLFFVPGLSSNGLKTMFENPFGTVGACFLCLAGMNFTRIIILEKRLDQETKKGDWRGLNW